LAAARLDRSRLRLFRFHFHDPRSNLFRYCLPFRYRVRVSARVWNMGIEAGDRMVPGVCCFRHASTGHGCGPAGRAKSPSARGCASVGNQQHCSSTASADALSFMQRYRASRSEVLRGVRRSSRLEVAARSPGGGVSDPVHRSLGLF